MLDQRSTIDERAEAAFNAPPPPPQWDDFDLDYDRPRLYPKQKAALFDPHRYALIEASTKAGKTAGAIAWFGEQAFDGGDGHNFWWVAPVSGQADIAFRRTMRAIPRDMQTSNLTQKTITLINGAVMWFKSGDKPDSLYGEDVYAAVVDEASRTKEDAFYALRSTLTFTRGPIRIIGNVKGRKNWFYQMARKAQAGAKDMGYHKIVAQDAIDAGVLAAEEVEDARRNLPERVFRELYLAEASDDEGNPFGYAHIKACATGWSQKPVACWGWDLGKSQDWTVGIGLDAAGDVSEFHRFQLPWPVTTKRIIDTVAGKPALIDSTGLGDPVLEFLQRDGGANFEGYHFTPGTKQQLMEGLAVSIQSHSIHFPPGSPECPIQIELEQFEYQYTRGGVKYSAPEGFHDDCVCALALADIHRHRAAPPLAISPDALKGAMVVPAYMARRRRRL